MTAMTVVNEGNTPSEVPRSDNPMESNRGVGDSGPSSGTPDPHYLARNLAQFDFRPSLVPPRMVNIPASKAPQDLSFYRFDQTPSRNQATFGAPNVPPHLPYGVAVQYHSSPLESVQDQPGVRTEVPPSVLMPLNTPSREDLLPRLVHYGAHQPPTPWSSPVPSSKTESFAHNLASKCDIDLEFFNHSPAHHKEVMLRNALTRYPLLTQKRWVGNAMYLKLRELEPSSVGMLTEMLLRLDIAELLHMAVSDIVFHRAVAKAKQMFEKHVSEYEVVGRSPFRVIGAYEEVHEDDGVRVLEDYSWFPAPQTVTTTEDDPFIICGHLGSGSLGTVEEVKIKEFPTRVLARKRVQLPNYRRREMLRIVQEETDILKGLSHPHIIRLLGSYEDTIRPNRRSYCLLMHPVGENDLRSFLEVVGEEDPSSPQRKQWHGWIDKWFLCLTSALVYLHNHGVRHQDIKPSNIIHAGENVYFTDFSSSSRFNLGSTTSTDNPARCSAMYGAPEVVDRMFADGSFRRHGRGSDIFSLGCVFCEMATLTHGGSVAKFHDFLLNQKHAAEPSYQGSFRGGLLLYHQRLIDIDRWFGPSRFFQDIIAPMISADRSMRPSASEVLDNILESLPTYDLRCFCANPRDKIYITQGSDLSIPVTPFDVADSRAESPGASAELTN